MKKMITRSAAATVCAGLVLSLSACGSSTASSEVSSEAASSEAASSEASSIPEDSDPLAQKAADFSYSGALDENGFFTNVRALDYVTLPDGYNALQIPVGEVEATDDELQTNLDYVLSQFATTEQDTESTIEDGDTVNIDYVGSVDGVEFTGGNTNGAGTDVTAGSDAYVDDFLTQIIGHKAGDTFDVTVTFPDGYSDGTDADGNTVVLANQEAVFKVTINYISRSVLPEMTDEFVQENIDSQYGTTVEEFKETLRQDIYDANVESYVTSYLTDNAVYAEELPESVTEYCGLMVLNYYYNIAANYYGMNLTQFVQDYMEVDSIQELLDQNEEAIAEQAQSLLLYQAVAEDQGLTTCSDDDVQTYFEELQTSDYSDYEDYYGSNYLRMNVIGSKAVDLAVSNSTVA